MCQVNTKTQGTMLSQDKQKSHSDTNTEKSSLEHHKLMGWQNYYLISSDRLQIPGCQSHQRNSGMQLCKKYHATVAKSHAIQITRSPLRKETSSHHVSPEAPKHWVTDLKGHQNAPGTISIARNPMQQRLL